jgi:hypothetical protein
MPYFNFSNNDGKHHRVKTPQQPGRNFPGKRLFLPKMGNIAAQKDQGNLPAQMPPHRVGAAV